MRVIFTSIIFIAAVLKLSAQVEYPYPTHYLHLIIENKLLQMAHMDVISNKSNGKTIILFHGKNFNGYYWKNVIPMLTEKGYRVIAPDQIGWGKSDHPDLHYSFQMLAENNKALLDFLHIEKVTVLGHSMGGMLAVRFALMFPNITEKLILEDPIGLEDYKTFVPYKSLEELYQKKYLRYTNHIKNISKVITLNGNLNTNNMYKRRHKTYKQKILMRLPGTTPSLIN